MKENQLIKFQNTEIFILNKAHIQLKIGETITSWVCYKPGLIFTIVETHTTVKHPQGYIIQHSLNRGLDIAKINIPSIDALFS